MLTVHIHLKSLSTGAPHPAGPQGGKITYNPKPGDYSYAIQTSEGYLGTLMSSREEDASELFIWEWRTGTLHLVRLSSSSCIASSRSKIHTEEKGGHALKFVVDFVTLAVYMAQRPELDREEPHIASFAWRELVQFYEAPQ